ncbi:endonuclease-8 [Haloechinothrix alba]|uniref:DNA-(apurinic or apyrimidinic site) lyase n=1 Tax=Haloechinothrix alba TaxID=664784 RepID=A0A238XME1_9PSEU|nr:DNA-formamidopyrimidine glycosylase family protein [Haloechinothrix alba]SNR59890.1 endonuclease-8 [Haloechinothrix alba]
MPEGHTLHRLAQLHTRRFGGRVVSVSSPQGRFASEAAQLDGAEFLRAEAYGKHLVHHYRERASVHVHLGLYGTFSEAERPESEPVGQVRMRIIGPTHWTDLRGPIRCELVDPGELDRLLAGLGPDPLRADSDPGDAWKRISRSRTSIAALLMDQSVLAGVGNVFRAELLFRHGIDPATPGEQFAERRWERMWTDLVELMRHGVRTGRIDTVRPEHMPEVTGRQPRDDRHGGEVYVYRRAGQPCHVCGSEVALRELAGRKLYWCPRCQGA